MSHIGIVFGPNGVGKGTLADHLAKTYRYTHLEMGNLFRSWVEKSNNAEAKEKLHNGKLINDEFVRTVLFDRLEELKQTNATNIILDGLPRSISQVQIVKEMLENYNFSIAWVIVLSAGLKDVMERVSNRVIAPDGKVYNTLFNPPPKQFTDEQLMRRSDDRPEVVKHRFESYMIDTFPCLSNSLFLEPPLMNIDARNSISQVFTDADQFMEQLKDQGIA